MVAHTLLLKNLIHPIGKKLSRLMTGAMGLYVFLYSPVLTTLLLLIAGTDQAQAYTFPNTIDPTITNQLKGLSGQVSQADFQAMVCNFYTATFIGYTDDPCTYLSQQPGFWNETQKYYYRMEGCNGQGVQYKGNFAAISSSPHSNGDYTDAQGHAYDANGNLLVPPVVTSTVSICNNPPGAFTNPSWFSPSPSGTTTVNVFFAAPWNLVVGRPLNNTGYVFCYWLQRFGPNYAGPDLAIPYTLGGTAVENVDFDIRPTGATETQGTFHIAAGRQANNIWNAALMRGQTVPERYVSMQVTTPPGYYFVGRTLNAVLEAVDVPPITATSATGSTTISAGASNTGVIFTRNSTNLTEAVNINYSVSGSAANGTDFNYLDGTITIPPGQASVTLPIQVPARNGSTPIPQKDITITVADGGNYYVEPTQPITLTIPAYSPGGISLAANSTLLTPGSSIPFTVTRSGDTTSSMVVNYTVGGTAIEGTDFSSLSGSVTIPAGKTSQSVPIVVPSTIPDTSNGRTLTITLAAGNGYAYTGVSPLTFTYQVARPSLSVAPNSPTLAPGATGGFTITRSTSAPITSSLTVNYTVGGTAVVGTDYAALTGSVTIPANATSVQVPVTALPKSNNTAVPDRTLTLSIDTSGAYNISSTAGSASLTISAYTPYVVSASGGGTVNAGQTANYTITRTGSTTQALTVNYTVTGMAQSGTDFAPLSGVAQIPAGQASVNVPISTFQRTGNTAQPSRTIVLTLQDGSNYNLGVPTSAIYILPAYTPTSVQVAATSTTLTPGTNGSFTITRAGDLTQQLAVSFTTSGTAVAGTDYVSFGDSAIIRAGQASVTVPISTIARTGGSTVGSKTLTVTLDTDAGYALGTANKVDFTLSASSATSVGVTAASTSLSVGQNMITIARSGGSNSTSLPVQYAITGTAVAGTDYSPLSGTVTIPANSSSVQVPITVLQQSGSSAIASRSIIVTLSSDTGYAVNSSQSSVTLNTPAYSPNAVTIAAPAATLSYSGGNKFTLTRAGATTGDLSVRYSVAGTAVSGTDYAPLTGSAVIPAGSASVDVPITLLPRTGNTSIPDRTIILGVSTSSSYSVGTQNSVTVTVPAYNPNTISVAGGGTANPGSTVNVTLSRTGSASLSLPVEYTISGTAAAGTDYQALPGIIQIPANQTSVTVPITINSRSGGATVADKTVIFTLVDGANYAISTQNSATYTIPGTSARTVGVTASSPTLNPGATNTFTLTRSGDTTQALTVNYTVGGTATTPADYGYLSGTVTIPAGSASVSVPVTAASRSGSTSIAQKTIVITVATASSYTPSTTASSTTFTIPAYAPVNVSMNATNTTLNPGANYVMVSRAGSNTSQALSINYSISGDAVEGTDYAPLSGSITIQPGQSEAALPITILPRSGNAAVADRTLSIALAGGNYSIDPALSGVDLTIPTYYPAYVDISSASPTLSVGANSVTINRSGNTNSDIPVRFTIGGTAVAGTDYSAIPSSVTIPSGQASVTIPITVLQRDASLTLPARTLTLTLADSTGYAVDQAAKTVSLTIPASNATGVTISGGAAVNNGGTATFTITRAGGSNTQALSVNYALTGTAQSATDYAPVTGVARIPAGSNSVQVPITTIARTGSTAIAARTIIATLEDGSGYAVGTTNNSTTFTLAAYAPRSVTVATSNVNIANGAPASFTVTRTGDLSQALAVDYTLSGTAVAGTDFVAPSGTVTIRAGDATATVPITTIARTGSSTIASRTLNVALDTSTNYAVGTANQVAFTLAAYAPRSVTVATSNVNIANGGQATFTFTRTGDLTQALAVDYTLSGTAVAGTDFVAPSGTATIRAGDSSVSVPITTIARTGSSAIASRTLNVAVDTSNNYAVGTANQVAFTLAAYAPRSVTVATSNANIANGGTASFTVTRTGDLTQPLTVDYTLSGTAVAGTDYVAPPSGTVTIKANEAIATVPITTLARTGSSTIASRTLNVALDTSTNYAVGTANQVAFTLGAYSPVSVSASGSGNANPDSTVNFTLTRAGGSTTQPLTVKYAVSGTAQSGTDYQALTGLAQIPVGQTSVNVPITVLPRNGSSAITDRTIILTVSADDGYAVGTTASSTFTIPAFAPTSIGLTSTGTTLPASGVSRFTIARTGSTTSDLTVRYSLSGTAVAGTDYVDPSGTTVIPAGSTSVDVPITILPRSGSTAIGTRTLNVAVQNGSNYAIGTNGTLNLTLPAYSPTQVTVAPVSASVVRGTSGPVFRITRTGDLSQSLPVTFAFSGTASSGSDYASISDTITIPAGQASANISLSTIRPTTTQVDETIILTLNSASAYALGATPNATVTLTGIQGASVAISASSTLLTPGTNNITISRTGGDLTRPLTVEYQTSGTAQAGTDYSFLSGFVTIPQNASSVQVPIQVQNRTGNTSVAERTLNINLIANSDYVIGGQSNVALTISPYAPTSVQVAGGSAVPSASTVNFTITRTGSTTNELPVRFTVGGTAVAGTDYVPLSSTTATIAAGEANVQVPLTILNRPGSQTVAERTITITLPDGTSYAAGTNKTTTFTLPASNARTVSLTPSTTGTRFTVTRTGDTTQPLTVNFSTTGSAVEGTDYAPISNSITIPAGQSQATVTVTPIPRTGDSAVAARTLTVALDPVAANSGYTLATGTTSTSFNFAAYTPGGVQVAGGQSLNRGENGNFTVTRSGDTTQPMAINYTLSGTAERGVDYTAPVTGNSGTITIPAGQTTISLPVTTLKASGDVAIPARTLTLTLTTGSGYQVGTTNTANMSIAGYTPTPAPIASVVTIANRSGGSMTLVPGQSTDGFTLTRNGDTTQALTVNYTTAGTAVNGTDYQALPGTVSFPAGQSSVTIPVVIPSGVSADRNGRTLSIALADGGNYDINTNGTAVLNYSLSVQPPTPAAITLQPGVLNSPNFFITRPESDVSRSVTLSYTTSGTAIAGTDYSPLSGSVTIPVGATNASIPLAISQAATAGRQVTLSLNAPPAGYQLSSNTVSYRIATGDIPAAPAPAAAIAIGTGVNGVPPVITVSRPSSDSDREVMIPYTVGGNAVPGTDYTPLSGAVTIGVGQTSANIPLTILQGATTGRTVSLNLIAPTGYQVSQQPNYTITSAAIPVAATTTTTTTPTVTPGLVFPQVGVTSDAMEFVISRSATDTSAPLTVRYAVDGTARVGVDYQALPGVATISAGQTSVRIPVTLLGSATTRAGRTLSLRILTSPTGTRANNTNRYTIAHNGTGSITFRNANSGNNSGGGNNSSSSDDGSGGSGGSGVGIIAGGAAIAGGTGLAVLTAGAGAAAAASNSCPVDGFNVPQPVIEWIEQVDANPISAASAPTADAEADGSMSDLSSLASLTFEKLPQVNGHQPSFTVDQADLEDYTLAQMWRMGMSSHQRVGESGMMSDSHLAGLVKLLGDQQISEMEGMAQWLQSLPAVAQLNLSVEELSNLTLAQLIEKSDAIAQVDLSQTLLSDIPGIGAIEMSQFAQMNIDQFAGLNQIPFSILYKCQTDSASSQADAPQNAEEAI